MGIKAVTRPADTGNMERAATSVLTLTCPRCRTRFPSMLRMDERTFEESHVGPIVERCPSCGWASRYERRDYYFLEESA